MISFGIFIKLLFHLHGCFASPTVCEVVLATKMIELPTNSILCDNYGLQQASLCSLESTLITCNDHGDIQTIDLSGAEIHGETNYDIEDMYLGV